MAQIRIEETKTSGGSIWPWIIGLLLLGLIIWGVAEAFDEADEEVYTEEEVIQNDDNVAPVATGVDENSNYNDYDSPTGDEYPYTDARQTYLTSTEDMEGEMGLGHEYSHRVLTELARATTSLASEKGLSDGAIKDKADRVKQLADELTRDAESTDHADKMKMAAMLITEMLEDIDTQSYGGQSSADLTKLREEAQAIDPATLTLEQKADMRSFFQQARTVIERMS